MPHLNLKILSGSEAGQKDNYSFTQLGGSIGRAEDCDWTLLDSDRFVSKKHLVISFRNQQFILTDVSSNGVIVNNSGSALGRGNEHILQANDTLVIGKHIVQVADISLDVEQTDSFQQHQDEGDLLGLVMGAETNNSSISTATQSSTDPLQMPVTPNPFENQNPFNDTQPESDQGLQDILSQPIQKPAEQPFSQSSEQSNPFDISSNPAPTFDLDDINKATESNPSVGDSMIPDDWDLFDSSASKDNFEPPQQTDSSLGHSVADKPLADVQPSHMPDEVLTPKSASPVVEPAIKDIADNQPEIVPSEPVAPVAPVAPNITTTSTASPNLASTSDDDFFDLLYEKLGLSKEFKAGINKQDFAEDIATILLSTTQGLMSLLASRTAFKQESRLSSTLIQPRSNNPIKFSIDPADTLEMLLVKKKKGYKSVEESYNEAVEDIQLHQMAFMAGLQGTLNGVLAELNPEDIEQQVSKKAQRFMGLNSNSQCWQIYKEKQPNLAKTVKENLNEVLGSYFSDAYQSQINSFKKEK